MRDKIIPLQVLLKNDYDDATLDLLFKTNSLILSLIDAELKLAGKNCKTINEVKQVVKNKNWMYKYFWSDKQRDEFSNNVQTVYKNVYTYSDVMAKSMMQWFIIMYGLTNKSVKNKVNQYKLCE